MTTKKNDTQAVPGAHSADPLTAHQERLRVIVGMPEGSDALAVYARLGALTAARAKLFELTGTHDDESCLAAIGELKRKSDELPALERKRAELEREAEAARFAEAARERAGVIAAGMLAGKITPADRDDPAWQQLVAGLSTADLRTYVARMRPAVPTVAHSPARVDEAEGLTDLDRDFARRAGLTDAQMLEQKRLDAREEAKRRGAR